MLPRWNALGGALGMSITIMLLLIGVSYSGAALRAQAQAQTPAQPLDRALHYLAVRQSADGSYGGLGFSADVTLAAAAAERSPATFGLAGRPAVLPALEAKVAPITRTLSAGTLGKLALAAVAGDANPRSFGGLNLPLSLTQALSATGAYDGEEFDHALAMLGVAAMSETVPVSASQWLLDRQKPGGGWDDGTGGGQQTDATALAVQALLAAGASPTSTAIVSATRFLSTTHNSDAGWGLSAGGTSNANSTAFAIQALTALGENIAAPTGTWAISGTTPLSALLALQQSSGGFAYTQGQPADAFSTWQAIPALAGRPLPIIGPREAARRSLAWLKSQQDASGGFEQFGGFGVNAAGTARAMRAIRAAGQSPLDQSWVSISGTTPLSALITLTPGYVANKRGGAAGNVMLGVLAAGAPYTVTSVGGLNLVLSVTQSLSPDGSLDSTDFGIYSHALAMLGLQQAGFFSGTIAQSTTNLLLTTPITGSADDAGIALQALAGAGVPRATEAVSNAIDFLRASQLADGGWDNGFDPASTTSNASSTSEALRGLLAYGVDPASLRRSTGGRLVSPLRLLIASQGRDGALLSFGSPDEASVSDALFVYGRGYPRSEFPLVLRERRLPLVLR